MAKVGPSRPRSLLEEGSDELTITTPVRRNWFLLLFIPVWLAAWTMGEIVIGSQVLRSLWTGSPGQDLFMIVWLIGWTVGGAFALASWLWNGWGQETLMITPVSLHLRRSVGSLSLSKEFEIGQVKDLRVSPVPLVHYGMNNTRPFWGYGDGTLAFDYYYKTYRFLGVDEAEAKYLLENIRKRYPDLFE